MQFYRRTDGAQATIVTAEEALEEINRAAAEPIGMDRLIKASSYNVAYRGGRRVVLAPIPVNHYLVTGITNRGKTGHLPVDPEGGNT